MKDIGRFSPFYRINEAFKKLIANITGFKSSCVTFCYVAFFFIVIYAMSSVLLLYILGGAVPTFVVHTDMVKDFYIPMVSVSKDLFIVAIIAIFGATAAQGYFEKDKQEEPKVETPQDMPQ